VGHTVPLFIGIEAKADDNGLSPVQKICHEEMKRARALVWTITGRLGVQDLVVKLRSFKK
jgi:hypothetical protein